MTRDGNYVRRDVKFLSILFYHLRHYPTASGNKMFQMPSDGEGVSHPSVLSVVKEIRAHLSRSLN